jgi:hypothetical protein
MEKSVRLFLFRALENDHSKRNELITQVNVDKMYPYFRTTQVKICFVYQGSIERLSSDYRATFVLIFNS